MRGMWKHLERLGGGVGTARPGRVPARDRPRLARRRISLLQAPAARLARSARRGARSARAAADADRRARRLHERRQVDAAERADRGRRLVDEPALRDARPDDARVRARRPALPRHRHRRLHPPAAARSSSRASRRRSRRRSSPISSCTSSTHPQPRPARRADRTRSRRCSAEIGADELPRLVLNKVDRFDREPPAAREPLPRRRCRSPPSPGRARRAARAVAERFAGASRACGCSSRTRGRRLAELYALGAPIRSARKPRRACSCRPAARRELPRFAPYLVAEQAARAAPRRDRAPVAAAAPDAEAPARAYAGDAGLDLAACERSSSPPRERGRRRHGLAVAIPEGYAASSSRARASPRKHGMTIVNAPGLIAPATAAR